jgi:hypothetical protein
MGALISLLADSRDKQTKLKQFRDPITLFYGKAYAKC